MFAEQDRRLPGRGERGGHHPQGGRRHQRVGRQVSPPGRLRRFGSTTDASPTLPLSPSTLSLLATDSQPRLDTISPFHTLGQILIVSCVWCRLCLTS